MNQCWGKRSDVLPFRPWREANFGPCPCPPGRELGDAETPAGAFNSDGRRKAAVHGVLPMLHNM